MEIPKTRDRNIVPAGVIEIHSLESGSPGRRVLAEVEFPFTIEAQCLLLVGSEAGPHRKAVDSEHFRVLPVLFDCIGGGTDLERGHQQPGSQHCCLYNVHQYLKY